MMSPAAPSLVRNVAMFRTPNLWPCWPYLPVRRPLPDNTGQQLGVLYDACGACGQYGYSATVFLANLYFLPRARDELFALPKCVYDTAEEMAEAGWTVD
jgi:hypothetical protein